jgi:hypothetical protein
MGALHRTVAARLIGLVAVSAVALTACASSATTAGHAGPASSAPAAASSSASAPVPAPVAAPACPAKYEATNSVWVPAQPHGVDGQGGLVPSSVPSAAVVCAYLHPDNGALTGSHPLTGSLAAIPATMSSAPAKTDSAVPCPQYFRAVDADDYLIGLAYPAGQLWVAVPRFHCAGASNGEFTTTTNLGDTVNAWYEASTATAVASPSPTQS